MSQDQMIILDKAPIKHARIDIGDFAIRNHADGKYGAICAAVNQMFKSYGPPVENLRLKIVKGPNDSTSVLLFEVDPNSDLTVPQETQEIITNESK